MSQEPEDVKPKLNLNIGHDGTQITVKVKANMKFAKIFAAAEQRFGKEPGTFKFTYDGARVQPTDTPGDLGMEDGDQIDAHLEQIGGGLWPEMES
ncbi:Ubiquitin-like protein SMT3 [Hypsizygus marmoreus]|uniref:Ubiquitin-like protein SMT3 n=1 Tax=Hypsizygus marmoreus TaxID=39966 RepID=A0A369JQH0_HYPMA|nr:Ubiquitin-like protein SMT3 [Hypsizygus marmoreus]